MSKGLLKLVPRFEGYSWGKGSVILLKDTFGGDPVKPTVNVGANGILF